LAVCQRSTRPSHCPTFVIFSDATIRALLIMDSRNGLFRIHDPGSAACDTVKASSCWPQRDFTITTVTKGAHTRGSTTCEKLLWPPLCPCHLSNWNPFVSVYQWFFQHWNLRWMFIITIALILSKAA
jgi:hypothetical protein